MQAQDPVVLPLQEALRDGDGDLVPDRSGERVTTGGRVISGVIGQEGGFKDFFIQSGPAGLDVVVSSAVPPPAIGDSVVVTGALVFEAGMTMLVESEPLVVPASPYVPEPVALTGRAAGALGTYRGRLVAVAGTVVGMSHSDDGAQLLLYPDGGDVVGVFVPSGRAAEFDLEGFQPGDRLGVTGVLGQYDETAPYDEGFLLYPRAPGDCERIGLPPAFYRRALGVGLALVLLAATWALALRRQVRRRTSALLASEGALRKSEEALREHAQALQEHARELGEAKAHAEEMLRLKSAFLNNMSHEIRTPLTAIIGYAGVLAEEVEGEHREFAGFIEKSGHRLMGTLNSVLDLAQLDSGATRLDVEPVDVLSEAEEALALLRPLAARKGLRLTLSGSTTALALADRAALHRVLTNLVGNAIKFTERGGVTVRVEADEEAVRLRVADTGMGISEAFLPHLFDEFKQESEGYERTHEGSGLGLAITRRLVELMGGAVRAESVPGQGSTFAVALRRSRAVPTGEGVGESPPARLQAEAGVGGGARPHAVGVLGQRPVGLPET